MNSLIYIDHCSSTQDEIMHFISSPQGQENFLSLYTCNQTRGRGQYGNAWASAPNENIAFSFCLKTQNIFTSFPLFNFYTAILIRDFLANLTQTEVKIKWPNDLILNNKKIGGLLFEKKGEHLVVGIGINVLQNHFESLPKAGSIFTQTGKAFDLKSLAEGLHKKLSEKIQHQPPQNILERYHHHLFKRDEVAVFEISGLRQNGIIRQVDEEGHLWIDLEKEGLQKFFHKEVELLY